MLYDQEDGKKQAMWTINSNLITETSQWKCTNGLDHTLTKRVYKQNKIMQKKTLNIDCMKAW